MEKLLLFYSSGSQLGWGVGFTPPYTHLGTFGNIWKHFWFSQLTAYHNLESSGGARDAARYPTMTGISPHRNELSSPKCQ